ncbi:MAG: polysaccharide deacetylase family protein [Alphaproteobacteria bacterium]|nr:polysaccharide deacetylase family protein [Alphaproteobacteria bacterium]
MRPGEITAKEFDDKMALIARYFNPLSLNDAVTKLKQGTLPQRAICVTFDDGYRDNADIAYPILKKHNIPATFYVATGFLDGGRMWNDTVIEAIRIYPKQSINLTEIDLGDYELNSDSQREVAAQKIIKQIKHLPQHERTEKVDAIASMVSKLPNDLMMDSTQIQTLSQQGVHIGGHTVTHPILSALTSEQAEQEISAGKAALENIIQQPVTEFAYPNGKPGQDYLPEHVDIVKKLGFKTAVSTQWGVSNRRSDLYQLNRFTPWDKTDGKFLSRLVLNFKII